MERLRPEAKEKKIESREKTDKYEKQTKRVSTKRNPKYEINTVRKIKHH